MNNSIFSYNVLHVILVWELFFFEPSKEIIPVGVTYSAKWEISKTFLYGFLYGLSKAYIWERKCHSRVDEW